MSTSETNLHVLKKKKFNIFSGKMHSEEFKFLIYKFYDCKEMDSDQ